MGVIQTCQVVQWREREEDDDGDDDDEWTRGVVASGGEEDRGGGDDSTAPKLKVGGRHAPLVCRIYLLLWSSPLLQTSQVARDSTPQGCFMVIKE